jgi:hypothetical protein
MEYRYLPLLTVAAGMALAASMALAQTVPNVFPLTPPSISTVPKNGDTNPYGVAFVPPTVPTDGVRRPGRRARSRRFIRTRRICTDRCDLVLAPNGHLLVANSDGSNTDPTQPSELVEFTTTGTFVAQFSVDMATGGAFGLSIFNLGYGGIRIGAVDDNANTITLWTAFVP